MSYGIRYIMTWLSEKNEDCRIEILEKDFAGEATVKKIGSAPVMRIDSSDGGLIGTSLQLAIQADVDGELTHLYTTDSKKYKVLLSKNGTPTWSGYLLQELYSENYIAAPYDVNITATDQLALLKDVPYQASGRMTLMEVIKKALAPTALDLDFAIQAQMKPVVLTDDVPFMAYITVNDYTFADSTCYEALQEIMMTCNMGLVQIDNRWTIYRKNDISAKIYKYSNNLALQQIISAPQRMIGQMHTDELYPIDSLTLTKIAAKKNAKVSYAPRMPKSILVDADTITADGWFWNTDYLNSKPGKKKYLIGHTTQYAEIQIDAFILYSTLGKSKDFALWQNVFVKKTNTTIKTEVAYLGLLSYASTSFNNHQVERTTKLLIHFKLVGQSGTTFYLNKDGWSEEDKQEIVYTGEMLNDTLSLRADKEKYSKAVIELPGFPDDGMFTISFRNDSRATGPSVSDNHGLEHFRVFPNMAISNVYITLPEIEGYNTEVALEDNATQKGDEYELCISDAYTIENQDLTVYNYIGYSGSIIESKWLLKDREFESFYQVMVQDIANTAGLLKNGFSGIIRGKNLLSLTYLEKFSFSKLRLITGEYNLYSDELSGEWEEIPEQMVDLRPYEIIVNNNSVVVQGGSGSTSSTSPGSGGSGTGNGNYVTNVALEAALKPILDWFELRTISDTVKVLHSKYGIVTDAEISIGGISEDIDDDDSGSFSRLDSWDDYNPANGDVLSAVLGYGLKTDIQSLQEQINNMGGGGLSSVTVKIGNTAYDSVDGVVSLPSYPVVPTLLSEFTDDVVAGHYLPIEGGYFANSLNYKSISAYPLILGSTNATEQSVILLRHNDVDKAQVGWSSSLGTYLYNTAAKAKLGINNNGVAYFNDYTLYHTGNFDPADYLPKSGGMITDQLYFPPTSKYISLRKYGSYNAGIGYDTAGDESVVLWASVKFTRLRWHAGIDLSDGIAAGTIMNITPDFEISKKSGEAVGYIAGNTIIHADNIGSQSVAKARSMYDFGVISTAFNANTSLSGGGRQSNYDNIALWGDSVPSGMQYGMIYQLQGDYQDGNALAGQLAWDVNHLGEDSTRNLWWRANDSTAFVNAKWHQIAFTDSNVASANKIITSGRATDINISDVVSCKYLIATAGVTNGPWSTQGVKILHFAWDSTTFASQLAIGTQVGYEDATNPANYRLAWRAQKNAIWGDWKYVAFTDSNVASATKLETARKIWGQIFDGTGNITGPLTIANNVGGLAIQDTSGIGRTLLELNSGNNIVFGRGISSLGYNVYYYANNHLFWYGKNAGEAMRINANGNVLIGTTTDNGGKLQVAGNISATGSLTIGGATLTWDATYNCLRVNTNLATDGELTAGGVSDAAVVTEYDSATEIAELNRRITELENRLAAYEQ